MQNWALEKAVKTWLKEPSEERMCRDFDHMEARFGINALAAYCGKSPHQHRIVHELTKACRTTTLAHVVKCGLDINVQRSSDGCTCLHLAIWNENAELQKHLISLGANLEIMNYHGESAADLQGIQKPKAFEIKAKLQGAKRSEDVLQTCQDYAMDFGHAEFAQALFVLIQRGGDPSSHPASGIVLGCSKSIVEGNADAMRVIAAALARKAVPELLDAFANTIRNSDLLVLEADVAADIAYSFAKANRRDPEVFHALALIAAPNLGRIDAVKISKICWAFGSKSCKELVLLESVEIELDRRLGEFTNQALPNILSSFARLHFCPAILGTACATAVVEQAGQYNAQDVANTLWAYANLGVINVEVYHALFSRAQVVSQDVYRHHTLTTAQERTSTQVQLLVAYEFCRNRCPEALAGLDEKFFVGLQELHRRAKLPSSLEEEDADLDSRTQMEFFEEDRLQGESDVCNGQSHDSFASFQGALTASSHHAGQSNQDSNSSRKSSLHREWMLYCDPGGRGNWWHCVDTEDFFFEEFPDNWAKFCDPSRPEHLGEYWYHQYTEEWFYTRTE